MEHPILPVVCKLIAFLVANVVRDEKEWIEWGLPFIEIAINSQVQDNSLNAQLLRDMHDKFCPLIGHGMSLIIEDKEKEGFTFIHSAEKQLCSIMQEVDIDESEMEKFVKSFLDHFFEYVLNSEEYDARARTIARRMCNALNISALEFSEMESAHWRTSSSSPPPPPLQQQWQEDSDSSAHMVKTQGQYFDAFNKDSKSIPAASLLASFRLWRVAFVAAGGGALMAVTGRLAAPTIMSTILPVICASTTLGQVSMAMSATLSCVGMTSFDIIPSIMSAYGATVAGQRMLNRTAPLGEFALEPLHVPGVIESCQQQLKRSKGVGAIEKVIPEGVSLRDQGGTSKENEETGDNDDNDDDMLIVESTVNGGTAQSSSSATVFVLISGHVARNVDPRQVWGANGISYSSSMGADKKSPVSTLLEVPTKVVSELEQSVSEELSVLRIPVRSATTAPAATTPTAATTTPRNSSFGPIESASQIASASELSAASASDTAFSAASTVKIEASAVVSETVLVAAKEVSSAQGGVSNVNQSLSSASADDWEEVGAPTMGWWRETAPAGDDYILNWEPDLLAQLNDSFQQMLVNEVVGQITGKIKGIVKGEILKYTPIPAIQTAAALPMMVMDKIRELDDPWVVAMDRARQAGKLLARVLLVEQRRGKFSTGSASDSCSSSTIGAGGKSSTYSSAIGEVEVGEAGEEGFEDRVASMVDSLSASLDNELHKKQQSAATTANTCLTGGGDAVVRVALEANALPRTGMRRPITLVGYGMGARLIFHCLETLAAEGGAAGRGIVEHAVLIGTPVGTTVKRWAAVRSVVAGRLVNGYASNDWLLALLYRAKTYDVGVAGLYPVRLRNSVSFGPTTQAAVTAAQKINLHATAPNCATTAAVPSCAVPSELDTKDLSKQAFIFNAESDAEWRSSTGGSGVNSAGAEVENIDLTDVISSHSDYPLVLPTIMRMVNLQ